MVLLCQTHLVLCGIYTHLVFRQSDFFANSDAIGSFIYSHFVALKFLRNFPFLAVSWLVE